jgi:hypothetical protein
MRYEQLVEKAPSSNIFGLMKVATAKLGDKARSALESWERVGWTGGPLETHVKANDEIAHEIEAAFAPVRAYLPETTTLYRGIIVDSDYTGWEKGILNSWSSDRRTAELFAGLRYGEKWKSRLSKVLSDAEIEQMVARYEQTGFLKTDQYYFVRNKEMPEYYNIYSKDKSFLTDGDDLARKLHDDNEWIRDRNEELKKTAKVFEEEISRDRILWITNQFNCKEFIVRR